MKTADASARAILEFLETPGSSGWDKFRFVAKALNEFAGAKVRGASLAWDMQNVVPILKQGCDEAFNEALEEAREALRLLMTRYDVKSEGVSAIISGMDAVRALKRDL